MFVVIPFCHKDEWLALKNLEWAKKLDGRVPYTAMVVHDDTISGDQVRHAAEQLFEKVVMFCYPKWPGRDLSWPIVQNHQFQEAATFISYNGPREPWLWWEPDAVPLKSGWIAAIEEAHQQGGKSFAGHIVTGDPFQQGHAISWMTGVGVYPFNVPSHSGAAMSCMRHPWDVASHLDVGKKCTPINHLIQHVWEIDGKPPHFADKRSANGIISKSAVLFHRCKDGSLVDMLDVEPIYKAAVSKIISAVGNVAASIKRELTNVGGLGVVQLGRYGDIANALPAIRALGEREGVIPTVVVAKDFASILDGVSYVKADVWDGPYDKLAEAVKYAKDRYDSVVVGTVWGSDSPVSKKCSAYNMDSWERLGALSEWGNPAPPSFDVRDRFREREIINKILPWTQEPIVLLSLSSGLSSPMPNGALIKSGLMKAFEGQCRFVDLDTVRFSHIFDAVGLMDFADALITSDTAWLHLAADTSVPVAAFLSPRGGWYQTEPRCNCTLPLRDSSSESVGRLYDWLRDRITSVRSHKFVQCAESHYPIPTRVRRAQKSWETMANSGGWDIQLLSEYPRDATGLGEQRKIPFLRDVLLHGLKRCGHDDYLVFTNDDTIILKGIKEEMDRVLSRGAALTSNRIDIDKWNGVPLTNVATNHQGRDVLCFRAGWLKKHINDFGDYVLGFCDWDIGIAAHIRWLCGKKWHHDTSWQYEDDCELRPGWVLHERHLPTYPDAMAHWTPGLMHNRKILKKWAIENSPDQCGSFHWWDKVKA